MRNNTILLIDSEASDSAEVIGCVSPAVSAAHLRLRTSAGIADGLRILRDMSTSRRRVAAVIVGPHVGEPLSVAREVNRLSPRTPVVVLAPPENAIEIEQALATLDRRRSSWTTASVDEDAIADAIHDVIASRSRKSRLRGDLDDVDEQLFFERQTNTITVGSESGRSGRGTSVHENSPTYAIVSIDDEGLIVTWNRAAEDLFGLAETEVLGRPLADLASSSSVEELNALLSDMKRGETVTRRELCCRHKDGTLLDAELTLTRVHHTPDPRIAISAIVRDVSARRRTERREAAQHEATRILAESKMLGEVTPRLLKSLCEVLGWDVGCWWSVDAASNVLRRDETCVVPALADMTLDSFSRDRSVAPEFGLASHVWKNGVPHCISDIANDPDFEVDSLLARNGFCAAIAFPVVSGRVIYGVVELLSRNVQSADAALLELMGAIGAQVGQFIDRRHAEHALRASHALNQAVLDSLDAQIALLDRQGRVIAVNEAWKRFARESSGDDGNVDIGANYLEVCRRALDASFTETRTALEGLRAVLSGTRPHFTMEYRSDIPGREHWFLVDATSLPTEIGGAVVSYLDIRDRKMVEEERARFLVATQETIRLKNEFVATISHELRNPLHAILGWTYLVRNGRLEEGIRVHGLEAIERNARQLSHVMDEVLDVSNMTESTLRPRLIQVDMASTILQAEESLRAAAEKKSVEIHTQIDYEAGHVLGDKDRLQQVIWNLVSNAIKFTPSGGRIDVGLRQSDSNVEVTVSDTGQGIDPSFLPHVFDLFRQEDGTIRRRQGGLGVGLAIVRHLTELHGGSVRAHSEGVGLGATFTITLPVMSSNIDQHATSPPIPTAGSPVQTARSLRGARVLLADDDPEARALVTAMLEHSGANVRSVASTGEGVEELKHWRPDVILSGICDQCSLMRTMQGLAPRRGRAIPAIALIARSGGDDRLNALSIGFRNHVYKPVDFVELTTVVANVLGRIAMTPND
ncbi:MAG: PAS domain S-box protein [Planctomycetes bacterium]|nr:PAS domain S-box protein [Planctomycetota bacterium]